MAFREEELRDVRVEMEKFIEANRPPPEKRDQVDLEYRIEGQSVVIFEDRMTFLGPDHPRLELPIAKATFVRASSEWKVFWRRASGKWHRYDPVPTLPTLAKVLELIDDDACGCFWG